MNHWDEIALRGEADNNMCHVSVERCIDRLSPIFQLKPDYVLELGCGVGRLTQPVAQRLRDQDRHSSKLLPMVDGIDSSEELLSIARDRLTIPNITYRHNDGLTIPKGYDMPLDAVYSIGMFQHVPADVMHGYLLQITNRIRPDGILVFQFVYEGEPGPYSYIYNPGDVVDWLRDWLFIKVRFDEENKWAWITATR